MDKQELAYRNLQRHLNRQAVGFPATRSGAEIRILKHIFTPHEAEIASRLSYKPEPLETIFDRCGSLVDSIETLAILLERIQSKGGIESRTNDGKTLYAIAPLVVGMFEMQLGRLTPDFIRNFDEYIGSFRFGIEFLGTRLPQMRTIPISKSIPLQLSVSNFDEVTATLQQAEPPFVILECICRKKKSLVGKECRVTDRQETCLAIGDIGQTVLNTGLGRQIEREEALEILEQNQKQGMVLQPSNTQNVDFICSCCGCCCGMLGLHKTLPQPLDFWATNYTASLKLEACNGCGICEKRCQVGAIQVGSDKQIAEIDRSLCIGCGLCVAGCPTDAVSLRKRPHQFSPPQTREELYDIIQANKQSSMGKLKMTTKLLIDSIRTGRFKLFE